jgi:hypothetical protein
MQHLGHSFVRAVFAAMFALVATSAIAQDPPAVATTGTADPAPRLWKDPGAIASRDLAWGIGSEARAPKGPFTFVEENTKDTQPKLVVTDANGVTWDVKLGVEAKSEVAASRLVHAFGYFVEELYYVPSGTIQGVTGLKRAMKELAADGTFSGARFRRRDAAIVPLEEKWTFKENPFLDSKELSGLLILMTMVNNWDIRGPRNNEVLRVTTPEGAIERRYAVGDLGGTFGRMGGMISNHSKWDLKDYQGEGFIEKVDEGVVHLDYDGFDSKMDRVPLEHARWFAGLASQLTEAQVRRAFEVAGATPEEVNGFSKRFMEKIAELQRAVK